MNKLNNKGVTLIELIVSFAIVSVAIVYFYQTFISVSKLYKKAEKNTDDYVKLSYIYKLIDTKLDNSIRDYLEYEVDGEKNLDLLKNNTEDNSYEENKLEERDCSRIYDNDLNIFNFTENGDTSYIKDYRIKGCIYNDKHLNVYFDINGKNYAYYYSLTKFLK